MKPYLLTATGKDRPGLVARVSKILFDEGCNLEDSAMTRLQDQFAILLIFSGSGRTAPLEKKLKTLSKKWGLAFQIQPLSSRRSGSPRKKTGERVLVSVYGTDRPGLVHRVTQGLAEDGVNLSDLSTCRTQSRGGRSGYILYVEGETTRPPVLLEKNLRNRLAELDVTVSVKPLASQAL